MNYYFITLMMLLAMSLGINLTRHGQQRTDNYNFFYIANSCNNRNCIGLFCN